MFKRYADLREGQLHYRYMGSGDPILLLHESGSNSIIYHGLMEYLSDRYCLIAPDHPGWGMSYVPSRRYDMVDYANTMFEFIDSLGIEEISIFGHHTGAAMACEMAALDSGIINNLIMFGPPYMDSEEIERRTRDLMPIVLKYDGSHLVEIWNKISPTNLEIWQRDVVARLQAGNEGHRTNEAVYQYDMASRLAMIKVPTLVMSGESDNFSHAVEVVASMISNADWEVMVGEGRYVLDENPNKVGVIVDEFIKKYKHSLRSGS